MAQEDMSFWQHVDVLRGSIIRCLAAVLVCGIAAFCFREPVFSAVFWPSQPSFPLWKIWPLTADQAALKLINTELTQQFIVHIEVALLVGLIAVLPYILIELMRFIGPALYAHEKKAMLPIATGGYTMFMIGVALAYFLIFPLTYRFLAAYQVSETVENLISLRSYISTLLMLATMMGILCELPVICGILARLGLLKASAMRRYRKHAIVIILIIAAVITPTGDAFTLMIVALPIYLLYELSIGIVRLQTR